jgi:hypothetical protein
MTRGWIDDIRPQYLRCEVDRRENGFSRQTRMLCNDLFDRLTGGEAIKDAFDGDARSGNDRLAHHDIRAGFDQVYS